MPLQHLSPDQAFVEIYNSELSEAAVLGFEYGFSRDYPEALTLWEAQFGDFANGAQIIIDQFISAGEEKWGLLSGLVLLLPHGYEGQGPEHSSARIERYLQLCARDNMQVCQPSSAAQFFHLLRRQALRKWRKPLICFTPKSMLRHPDAASDLAALSAPRFKTVIPDTQAVPLEVMHIVLCTGKIGHDLEAERKRLNNTNTAILRLDQIYPFPEQDILDALAPYQECTRTGVGTGRTGQHGRAQLCEAASAPPGRREVAGTLDQASGCGKPRNRLRQSSPDGATHPGFHGFLQLERFSLAGENLTAFAGSWFSAPGARSRRHRAGSDRCEESPGRAPHKL